MTTTKSNSPGISQRTNVYAARTMLRHAQPEIVLASLADSKPLPKNKSTVIKFRRPKPFTAADKPLQEGVTPEPTQMRFEDVSATIKQYGQVVEITDVIEDTHEDPVLNEASEQCGENIGRTIEAVTWGIVKAGTNVFYANGASRAAVTEVISLAKQRAVARALRAQKAMKITKAVSGGPDYATHPVEPAYVAVGHTDTEADIRNLPGFRTPTEYASGGKMHEYECGAVENVRYVLSSDLEPFESAGGTPNGVVSTDGSSADVYPVLYFGKNAFGAVRLKGQGAVEPSIIPVGQKTKDDVLGQRGYVGWKTYFTALILNQAWMARLEVAVTEL